MDAHQHDKIREAIMGILFTPQPEVLEKMLLVLTLVKEIAKQKEDDLLMQLDPKAMPNA